MGSIIVILVIAAIAFAGLSGTKKRKQTTLRDDRRERHRLRDRDWWVSQWLFGNRATKRLTDQRGNSNETL